MRLRNFAVLAAIALGAIACHPTRARADGCVADPAWFPHAQTREPDSAQFPADPTNCDFHRWSWQMFLWLTQADPATGKLRFETFADPASLDPALPHDGTLLPALDLKGFRPLGTYLQAGTDGILVDQNGRIVYYTLYLNDVFAKFIKDNHLDTVENIRKFAPDKPFGMDTLELKAAWKVLGKGDDPARFYTRKASIHPLVKKGGGYAVDRTKIEEVTVALVGFHIGGIVAHHDEMIWATFEHADNAPDVASLPTVKPDTVISTRNWSFYKAGTPFKDCNVNPAGSGTQTLDEKTQVMAPVTQACRLYPFGSGADKQANADNIKSIDASAESQVDGVWKNYFEVGAIWFDTGAGKDLQPNCTFQPGALQCGVVITGSTHLSNATIETFTQSQSTLDNCFACHQTMQRFPPKKSLAPLPGMDIDISHILVNLYFDLQQQNAAKAK